MLKTELKTATNIKNKQNRNNVERCLRLVIEKLKTYSKNENGFYIWCGINKHGDEVISVTIPTIPSSLSYYRCDNKFHTWMVQSVGADDKDKCFLLVLIYGDYCVMFKCSANQIIKIFQHNPLLVKRQSKGGSSSGRFSRIAEESRAHYVAMVCDQVRTILRENDRLPVVVDGGRELVGDLKAQLEKQMHVTPKVLDFFHEYKQGIVTQNVALIKQTLAELYDDTEKVVGDFLEDFLRNSDLYLVGLDEINQSIDQIELVVCLVDYKDGNIGKKIVHVPFNSKHYATIKSFGGILAKKYF